jgi:gas vesicle protein
MSSDTRRAAKVAALVAGGAVIGAGLGLLFAPQSGEETRRQIRHMTKRVRVQTTRFGRNLKGGLEQIMGNGAAGAGNREEQAAFGAA